MGTEIRGFGPIEYEGFSLTGEYEYTPEAPATPDIPGDAAQVHIVEARINGIPRNAIDLVGDGVIQTLEDLIAAGMPAISDADYDEGPAFDEWRFDREAA